LTPAAQTAAARARDDALACAMHPKGGMARTSSTGAALRIARDPVASASCAGLRYVSDASAGIRRIATARTHKYLWPTGEPLRDLEVRRRIERLAIPPAWRDVWICPFANGHIQATGRDARGRKQYRYHPQWRQVRDEAKYGRMTAFAARLPALRARVERDLARPGLPREKVIATVVRLLETTLIRVGNEEYARDNGSFGLTTLRDRHVAVHGSALRFRFRGKSGVVRVVEAHDRRLAGIIRKCQELPGHELFHYQDELGETQSVESTDVNEYLHSAAGETFTAKDFRTWYGTLLAARALRETPEGKPTKRAVVRAIAAAAGRLGNTPSVCRKCYVHPGVVARYLRGGLPACAPDQEEAALVSILEGEARDETSLADKLRRSLARPQRQLPRKSRRRKAS
jgi:DNA topoisomerase-1